MGPVASGENAGDVIGNGPDILSEAVRNLGDRNIKDMLKNFDLIGDKPGDPVAQVKVIISGEDTAGRAIIKEKKLQIHKMLLDRLAKLQKGTSSYESYRVILEALLLKEAGHYNSLQNYDLVKLAYLRQQYRDNPGDVDNVSALARMQIYYEAEQYQLMYNYLIKNLGGGDYNRVVSILNAMKDGESDEFSKDLLNGVINSWKIIAEKV